MQCLRFVLSACLILPAGLASSAQDRPADPVMLFESCLEKLGKLPWLETAYRHHVHGGVSHLMSEGKYIVAPERKASVYTCRVSVGKSPGELRIYCDGERIWRILDNGPSREVRTYTLAKLLEAREQIDKTLLGPELTAQLIRDDDAEHGFLGPRGVLLEMKEKLVWSAVKHGQLPGGRSVFILEGEWTKAFVDKLAPARKEGGSGPDLREMWTKRTGFIRIPRRCLLYLDKETLWPYRVEWQGPTVPEGKDEALVILEFQTPSLSAPASPEAFAKIFQPSDSEKEAAQEMDPALILQTRERNLLRQTRQEAESSRDQPLLDPTAPHKRP